MKNYCQEEDDGISVIEEKRREETVIHVDPPEGWRYDFPKIWNKNKFPDLNSWLIQEGYPKEKIQEYGERFYCRFWYKNT